MRSSILALLIVALAAVLTIVTSGSGRYELRATFDDVRGLIPGGQVRAGAIEVGSVRRVFLNEAGYPEVVMSVDDDFRVHEGATADVRFGSNAGVVNRVIELGQGDTAAPALPSGATLGRDKTDQPVNFDEAAETLTPRTRDDIRQFLGGLDRATRGRAGDLAATLRDSTPALEETANLLEQAGSDGTALRTMVRQGANVVDALASSPDDVAAAVHETSALLRTTAHRDAELRVSARLVGPALTRSRVLLGRVEHAMPRVRALVNGLSPVLDELAPLAPLLPPARRAAGPFVRETRTLVRQAPRDLRRLRPIINAAFPAVKVVGPLARNALPLAQALRAYAPEVSGFLTNATSAIGGYNQAGHTINVNANLGPPTGQSAQPVDQNACTAGLLKLPHLRAPGAVVCQPWTDYQSSFLTAAPGGGG